PASPSQPWPKPGRATSGGRGGAGGAGPVAAPPSGSAGGPPIGGGKGDDLAVPRQAGGPFGLLPKGARASRLDGGPRGGGPGARGALAWRTGVVGLRAPGYGEVGAHGGAGPRPPNGADGDHVLPRGQ